jgi:anti-anti-sigma regulatory factor
MDFMQFVGQPFERIFPSLADTETPSRYREAARDGTPWYTERIYNDRIFEIYAFQTSPGTMVSAFSDITARKQAEQERAELQQEVIDAQKRAIQELSSPIIPLMEEIIVMPLIGTIDTQRARDVTRSLLAGITEHRARIVILDVTGVPVIDTGIAQHLDKAIQAAQLKGTDTIITGITDAVAEAVVDLGIDWGGLKTMRDLQTGLVVALRSMGMKLDKGR